MESTGIKKGWNMLINRYTAIKSSVAQRLAPYVKPIADKIGPYWQPISKKYALTEPVRQWHRKLKAKNPVLAGFIQWSYDLTRYGIYFSLALYFCMDRFVWSYAGQ